MNTDKKPRIVIPAEQARTEIKVVNSRFIASAAPAFSVDQAKSFIADIKQEFYDASHNVPIFIIGHGASITAHSSDDGEPSGTAGRPALAVLQGSGLGDVAVVITRYFGGTKLGTGGLVRAYSDAVRAILAILPLAEKVPTHTITIRLPYKYYQQVQRLIENHAGTIQNKTFGADVSISSYFSVEKFPSFQAALHELSHGALEAAITETNPAAIIPLNR